MKTFNIETIRGFRPKPGYDPVVYLPEDWSGTALDILNVEECPPWYRLGVVLRQEILDVKTLHLLACDFAESVLPIWEEYGPKGEHFGAPKRAIDTKRRWVKGECTDDELTVAYTAARTAGRAAWAIWWVSRESSKESIRGKHPGKASWSDREAAKATREAAFAAANAAAWEADRGAVFASIWAACAASREAANAAGGKDPAAIREDQIKTVKKYL